MGPLAVRKLKAIEVHHEWGAAPSTRGIRAAELVTSNLTECEYTATIASPKNSYQIKLLLDEALQCSLSSQELVVAAEPYLVPEHLVRSKEPADLRRADLLVQLNAELPSLVVEIEKANKFKTARDLLRLLLFMRELERSPGKRSSEALGALICPHNYVHGGKKPWDVFQEAVSSLDLLRRGAELPEQRLSELVIIGYTQQVWNGENWVMWDNAAYTQMKEDAKGTYRTLTGTASIAKK